MTHISLDSIPVELQYIIAKFCGLDYTSVFNLLMVLPGLKTYVESYQHLKQELNKGFLEAKEKHKDGYKVCYFLKGGVKTGECKKWNSKGALIKHCHYKNGRLNGEFKWWYYNGQLFKHYFYKNDKLDGECKMWYSDGQLYTHCFYKNDKLNGECKSWHADGQLNTHCFYKNDKLDGECKWWDDNGQLFKHCFYKNDKQRWRM